MDLWKIPPFPSDTTLVEARKNRTSHGSSPYRMEQRVSSETDKDQAPNHYEYPKSNYEYIIEDQLSPGNQGSSSSFFPTGKGNLFRKKSNPLYIQVYDDVKPTKKRCGPVHDKCLVLAVLVCVVISLSSMATASYAWISKETKQNTSKPVIVISEDLKLLEQLRNLTEQVEEFKSKLKNVPEDMQLIRKSILHNEGDINSLKINLLKIRNQSTIDFNQCQYKTKERGRSNKQPYTLSDLIPEPPVDIRNWIITGVHCVVDGGTTATLKFDGSRYQCNCSGETNEQSRYCRIHYWYCPKTPKNVN